MEKHDVAVLVTCTLKETSESRKTPRYLTEADGRTKVLPIQIEEEGFKSRRGLDEHHKNSVLLSFS